MKRGRRIALALLGCVAVVLIVSVSWPREREPAFQGKKLSEWLHASASNNRPGGPDEQAAAKEAIRRIGTNALPCLVRWLAYEPPKWHSTALQVTQRMRFRWLWKTFLKSMARPHYAEIGFEILGPRARPAIPELERMAKQTGTRQSKEMAMWALMHIGAEGLPALIAILENGDAAGYETAGICVLRLNEAGVDVRTAVPGLLLADRGARQHATILSPDPGFLVDQLNYDSVALVPVLTNCLWHSNATVRLEAAQYLGWLSEKATSAEPALSRAFEDRDAGVREAATNAVHRIVQGILEQDREKTWAR